MFIPHAYWPEIEVISDFERHSENESLEYEIARETAVLGAAFDLGVCVDDVEQALEATIDVRDTVCITYLPGGATIYCTNRFSTYWSR